MQAGLFRSKTGCCRLKKVSCASELGCVLFNCRKCALFTAGAASKVASWEASVQEGTFNVASSGVCFVSSSADGAKVTVAVERGRERV